MTTHYYVPGMMYPFWVVADDLDIAHNRASDTDMGGLSIAEFTEYFLPRAIRITEEQYDRGEKP
jgi:hypothetical protein